MIQIQDNVSVKTYADVQEIADYVAQRIAEIPPPNIEMPFTVYNNSEQPSDKWAKLARITIDIERNRFWNSHFITFDFSMTTRALILDNDSSEQEFTIMGKALCNVRSFQGGNSYANFTLTLGDTQCFNCYCGLLKEELSDNKFIWDVWFHNYKIKDEDANSTFIKINNIQVIGTEIEYYNQIHIDYFAQQINDLLEAPNDDYEVFQLLTA
jgi:hypothetical protein